MTPLPHTPQLSFSSGTFLRNFFCLFWGVCIPSTTVGFGFGFEGFGRSVQYISSPAKQSGGNARLALPAFRVQLWKLNFNYACMPINPPSSHPVVHSSKHVALWVHQKSSENSCPNVHGRRRNSSTHPNEKSLLKDGCGNLYIIRGTLTVQAEWGANLKWRDEGQEVRRMFSSIHLLLPEFYVVLAAALFFNTWKQQKKKPTERRRADSI